MSEAVEVKEEPGEVKKEPTEGGVPADPKVEGVAPPEPKVEGGGEEEEEDDEEEEEYEVERIVSSKKTKGVSYYLVRWKNYGSDDDTWEPEDNLVDCKEALEEYKTRTAAPPKRKRFFSSGDDEVDSLPAKKEKVVEKKKVEKKEKKKEVKKVEVKRDKSEAKREKSEVKKAKADVKKSEAKKSEKADKVEKQQEGKKEQKKEKRTYKLADEDTIGITTGTPRPEKKKIPKKANTPQRSSQVLANAARFFSDKQPQDPRTPIERSSTDRSASLERASLDRPLDVRQMKQERKKKRREKMVQQHHPEPVVDEMASAAEVEQDAFTSSINHLEDLILPFGVDVRVPQADGVHRVTLPVPLEFEDPSGKMSGLENINWTLPVYHNALDLLIKNNCIQDVQTLLMKRKLNINQVYGERTLISLAVQHGKRRMLEMLLKYHPDVNQTLEKGKIALHVAAELGYTEVCVSLIEGGSHINARDAVLETSLMKAAEAGHRSTVEMLLDYGANLSLVNAACRTAEELARERLHEFTAQKIRQHGEQLGDAFISAHSRGGCILKDQLLPVHTIFPEFNSTFTLCFPVERAMTCKLLVSRLSIRKGDVGKLIDQCTIKCQWMNKILSLEYPGSVVFQPRLGLNTLVLNFKDYIKNYGIEPLLVTCFECVILKRNTESKT